MRKNLLNTFIAGISLLILISLFLLPIYKINTSYIEENFIHEIEDITKEEPQELYEHVFTKESLDNIITVSTGVHKADLSNYSWDVSFHNSAHKYEETLDGLKIYDGITFTCLDFKDFVKLAIFASGENTNLNVKVNDELVGNYPLTTNIERYDFIKEVTDGAKIEISFDNTVTLKRMKINEWDPFTMDNARFEFYFRVFMYSGLISKTGDFDGLSSYEDYIKTQTADLMNGISFLDLFRMLIEDLKYDFSVFSASSGMSIKDRFAYYTENRYCPFVSLLVFLSALGILGSAVALIVMFILEKMFKAQKNYIIPSIVLIGSLAVLLNISTFTGVNFFTFDGSHNIATEHRLLLFEAVNLNYSFVISIVLSVVVILLNIVNIVLDYVENKKERKFKNNLYIFIPIISVFLVLITLGLIIR